MHTNTMKLRLTGLLAPVAIALTLSAPMAIGADAVDRYWSAAEPQTAWVNPYGECWQSAGGPTDLSPCVAKAESVADAVTVHLNFEFDKYQVPADVVNREMIAKIDDYIKKVSDSPQQEFVTVVGHTDAKGSYEYNDALGQRRADAVRSYIIAQGYPASQMAPAESRGKRELLPGIDPYSVEQRRVVLTKKDM